MTRQLMQQDLALILLGVALVAALVVAPVMLYFSPERAAMERIRLQIIAATGMRDEARIARLMNMMQEESDTPLADLDDAQLRRLARANHGPLLAKIEAEKRKAAGGANG